MSVLPVNVWEELAAGRPRGETLWARRAAPGVAPRLLAALDSMRYRHFLVQLRAGDNGLNNWETCGIQITTKELMLPGSDTSRYLDIRCHDPLGHDAFQLIGKEIAEKLAAGREAPDRIVLKSIARWRRFWRQRPRDLLSREQQLALFAEVWFLAFRLRPRVSPPYSPPETA